MADIRWEMVESGATDAGETSLMPHPSFQCRWGVSPLPTRVSRARLYFVSELQRRRQRGSVNCIVSQAGMKR